MQRRQNEIIHKRYGVGAGPIDVNPVVFVDQDVRMSPRMEFAIVSGLGFLVFASPAIVQYICRKVQVIKARLVLLKNSLSQADFARKLELLNRRRKVGSIVRVLGTILPNGMFTPPCRIYIPKWAQLGNNQWTFHQGFEELTPIRNPDLPSENEVGDGVIEAFELDSEVISSLSGGEDDDEETSSTPEGWTQEQRLMANFNPTIINATQIDTSMTSYTRCSTPNPKPRKKNIFPQVNETQQGPSQNKSKLFDGQTQEEEVENLKKMVISLMMENYTLKNASFSSQATQLATQLSALSLNGLSASNSPSIPVPPPLPMTSQCSNPIITVTPIQNAPPSIPGPPPPPPPPPPPMPPMPMEVRKLVITKKGDQNKLIEKKPAVSLTDVLKELPNAKLRRVERSPGGTPLKPQLKLANEGKPLDIGSQLASALKKRYESMHSPACDSDLDKENMDSGSGDSFDDDSPSPAKRVLFPPIRSSPRKRSSGNQEHRLPFGQHLLKKRNVNGTEKSPLATSPFREKNN